MDCLDELEGPLLLTNVFRYFARNVQIQGNHYTVIIFLENSVSALLTGRSPSGDDRSGRRGLVDPMSGSTYSSRDLSFPTDHVVATPIIIVLLAEARKSMM